MKSAIVHCEIRVGNMERAVKFYRDVFGWQIEQMGDYWIGRCGRATYEGGVTSGIDAAFALRDSAAPSGDQVNSFICNIEVEDIDATLKNLEAAGGTIIRPKQPLEGVGYEAFCRDTEGNIISVMHDVSLVGISEAHS